MEYGKVSYDSHIVTEWSCHVKVTVITCDKVVT